MSWTSRTVDALEKLSETNPQKVRRMICRFLRNNIKYVSSQYQVRIEKGLKISDEEYFSGARKVVKKLELEHMLCQRPRDD